MRPLAREPAVSILPINDPDQRLGEIPSVSAKLGCRPGSETGLSWLMLAFMLLVIVSLRNAFFLAVQRIIPRNVTPNLAETRFLLPVR